MATTPIIVEKTFNVPVERVWKAITDKNEMKQWYFDIPDFKAEVGFEFQFYGEGKTGEKFLHLCKITDVVKNKKLRHSWCYDGYEGNSFVTFELFDEGGQTRLKLTHEGLETFPKTATDDFAKENFTEGWTYIVNIALNDYLNPAGKKNYQRTETFDAGVENVIYECLTSRINEWWSDDFEGSASRISDRFTVRFGETFKVFQVEELSSDQKVVWSCADAYINYSELKNKKEWIGTRVSWDILAGDKSTKLMLTHFGLTPTLECYMICEKGWIQFMDSLKKLVTEGKGLPQKKLTAAL